MKKLPELEGDISRFIEKILEKQMQAARAVGNSPKARNFGNWVILKAEDFPSVRMDATPIAPISPAAPVEEPEHRGKRRWNDPGFWGEIPKDGSPFGLDGLSLVCDIKVAVPDKEKPDAYLNRIYMRMKTKGETGSQRPASCLIKGSSGAREVHLLLYEKNGKTGKK